MFGEHIVCGRWRVVAYLRPDPQAVSVCWMWPGPAPNRPGVSLPRAQYEWLCGPGNQDTRQGLGPPERTVLQWESKGMPRGAAWVALDGGRAGASQLLWA